MSKVSYPTSVVVGLAGPKVHLKGKTDGEQVNIPALQIIRYTMRGRMVCTSTPHELGVGYTKDGKVGKSAFHYIEV